MRLGRLAAGGAVCAAGRGDGGRGRPAARPPADRRRPLPGGLRAAAAASRRRPRAMRPSTCCWARRRCAPSAPSRRRHCSSAAWRCSPIRSRRTWAWAGPTWRWATMRRAKIEFETVLRFDDLPPDLQSQAEIYAEAAQRLCRGPARCWPAAMPSSATATTASAPSAAGRDNDAFFAARVGGNLNYELDDGYALDGSLDYRFRDYDNAEAGATIPTCAGTARSAAPWARATGSSACAAASATAATATTATTSACTATTACASTPTTRSAPGLELRQRRYPTGPLRERTRNIVELTGSWTHSLLDGKASFTLAGAGRARVQHRARRRRCQLLRLVAFVQLQHHRQARRLRLRAGGRTTATTSSAWARPATAWWASARATTTCTRSAAA